MDSSTVKYIMTQEQIICSALVFGSLQDGLSGSYHIFFSSILLSYCLYISRVDLLPVCDCRILQDSPVDEDDPELCYQ